jgi:hypothetical protein
MFGFRCPEDLGRGVDLFYNAFVEKGDTVRGHCQIKLG